MPQIFLENFQKEITGLIYEKHIEWNVVKHSYQVWNRMQNHM